MKNLIILGKISFLSSDEPELKVSFSPEAYSIIHLHTFQSIILGKIECRKCTFHLSSHAKLQMRVVASLPLVKHNKPNCYCEHSSVSFICDNLSRLIYKNQLYQPETTFSLNSSGLIFGFFF